MKEVSDVHSCVLTHMLCPLLAKKVNESCENSQNAPHNGVDTCSSRVTKLQQLMNRSSTITNKLKTKLTKNELTKN